MTGLLTAINNGRANVKELDDPTALRRRVADLTMIRQTRFAGHGLYAATPHAERLIGAAMMLDRTIRADGVGDTVIVGVNIASGTQIARAATRLRESGNRGVLVGVVFNALIQKWHYDVDAWRVSEVDELLIVDSPNASVLGELAQRGEYSVSLALQ
jgi:hypothetical protein